MLFNKTSNFLMTATRATLAGFPASAQMVGTCDFGNARHKTLIIKEVE